MPVVYAIFGAAMAVSVLGFLLVPGLKEFLALEHEHVEDRYARQYPRVFV